MKKVILVGLLLVSWVCAKSFEQVQSEWQQKMSAKSQEAMQKWHQNEEVQRTILHCQESMDKGACKRLFKLTIKSCNKGETLSCYTATRAYLDGGGEMWEVSPDLKKAQSYADKVCSMDAVFCANMALLFFQYEDIKLTLKYSEKACEMGELYGCVLAYAGFNDDIDENPQKIKYYADKLCKGGVSEVCGK